MFVSVSVKNEPQSSREVIDPKERQISEAHTCWVWLASYLVWALSWICAENNFDSRGVFLLLLSSTCTTSRPSVPPTPPQQRGACRTISHLGGVESSLRLHS